MIEANELRIGNYLSTGVVYKIDEEEVYTISNVIQELSSSAVRIDPIPLTEEWLLKFDFENRGDRFYYGCLDITLINDCFVWDCSDIIDWPQIKHVHQLQNLYFALTGQELTIKN
jgi:hypothetical protein